jgi:glycosyltransferase involved in cell wall biosynthesis
LESHIQTLSNAWEHLGVTTDVIAGPISSESQDTDQFRNFHVMDELQYLDSLESNLIASKKISAYIKTNMIDVLNVHPFSAILPSFLAAKDCRIPFFITLHGPASLSNFSEDTESLIFNVVFPNADAIFVVSEEVLELASLKSPDAKYILIPNSVDFPELCSVDVVNGRWALIGRIEHGKEEGMADFIKQAQMLDIPELHVIGDGHMKEYLETIIDFSVSKTKVKFLGWDSSSPSSRQMYDVIGGMGRVTLEAVANKRVAVLVGYDGVKGVVSAENFGIMSKANFSGRNLPNSSISLPAIIEARANLDSVYEIAKKSNASRDLSQKIIDAFTLANQENSDHKAIEKAFESQILCNYLEKQIALLDSKIFENTKLLQEEISWREKVLEAATTELNQTVEEISRREKVLEATTTELNQTVEEISRREKVLEATTTELNQTVEEISRREKVLEEKLYLLHSKLNSSRLRRTLKRCLPHFLSTYASSFMWHSKNFGFAVALKKSLKFIKRVSRDKFFTWKTGFIKKPKNRWNQVSGIVQPKGNNPPPSTKLLVHYLDEIKAGGLEQVVSDLTHEFEGAGFRCEIVSAKAKREGQDYSLFKDRKIHFIEESEQNLINLIDVFRQEADEVTVFCHHVYFALDVLKNAKINTTEVLHNTYTWQIQNSNLSNKRSLFINSFIAVSDLVRNYSIEALGIPEKKISVVNNGLNPARFTRPPLELMRQKREKSISAPELVHLANLHPQKNHLVTLKAFRNLLDDYPSARLNLIGEYDKSSSLYRSLKNFIGENSMKNSVTFSGPLDSVSISRILSVSHVGLLPSSFEGFSLASLEYLFFALPLVSTPVGAAVALESKGAPIILCGKKEIQDMQGTLSIAEQDRLALELTRAISTVIQDYSNWSTKSINYAKNFDDHFVRKTAEEHIRVAYETKP